MYFLREIVADILEMAFNTGAKFLQKKRPLFLSKVPVL